MRVAALVLVAWSLAWGGGFVVDFLRDTAWRRHLAPPFNAGRHTIVVVVFSAVGSLVVIAAAVLDPLLATAWTRWLLPVAVGGFAGIGFPAWWWLQRQLRRSVREQT